MDIIEAVVRKNWCIGCGMCAALCPTQRLVMEFNDRGELTPFPAGDDCRGSCSVCYDVCPMYGQNKDETTIGLEYFGETESAQYTPDTGWFQAAYVGYSLTDAHRRNGASGGMATWLLEELLVKGEVDAVAAVMRSPGANRLFGYTICHTEESVRQCAKSAYYPVELSGVIQHIMDSPGRYAIIGLPCVCKALRLAQQQIPKLKRRIKYVLGLTCGHQCSACFAEYICALGGGNPYRLSDIIFRAGNDGKTSSNHALSFSSRDGDQGERSGTIYWKDGVARAYCYRFFQLLGCFSCDDIFAECADAVFMDAWLPEYIQDPEGHSIVVVRNQRLSQMLVSKARRAVHIRRLPNEDVILSQSGVIHNKRTFWKHDGIRHKSRRLELFHDGGVIDSWNKRILYNIAYVSPIIWRQSGKLTVRFHRQIKWHVWTATVLRRAAGLLAVFNRASFPDK